MSASTIVDIRATPVTVPLQAPLLHSNGAHWGRFVRTVVEVETADGYVGLGELGGGGQAASAAVTGLLDYLKGHDVFRLESMRFAVCNPTASLYNNRTQVHAAIEFACLDIIGQKLGIPVSEFLGGRVRDSLDFASYLFFRRPDEVTGQGEVRTVEQLTAHLRQLKAEHGFRVHKLKGGVYPPRHELACYQALAAAAPGERLRLAGRRGNLGGRVRRLHGPGVSDPGDPRPAGQEHGDHPAGRAGHAGHQHGQAPAVVVLALFAD